MDIKHLLQKKGISMRHEEKFICSEKQLILLEHRLKHLLPRDAHQTGEAYSVRSLYLDTATDRFLHESLSGIRERSKFRIRIYNASDAVIRLEKKTARGALKQKSSCVLDRRCTESILSGQFSYDDAYGTSLLEECYALQSGEGLAPKIIVEYSRTALVSPFGNVRITFDRKIRACAHPGEFFSPALLAYPVLPDGQAVLEIKYDGVLPGTIARALDTGSLQRVSFSKYGLCRNIIENNGRIEEYYEF